MKLRLPLSVIVILLTLSVLGLVVFVAIPAVEKYLVQTVVQTHGSEVDRAMIRACREAELNPKASPNERQATGEHCDALEAAYRKRHGHAP